MQIKLLLMQKTVNLAARPVLCGFCPDLTLRLDTQCCFTCMFVCLYGGKPLFSLAPAHFLPARIFNFSHYFKYETRELFLDK